MSLLSAAEVAGFAVFGDRARVVHGERMYEPAVGANAVRSLLRQGYVETEENVVRIFNEIGFGTETARVFLTRREVVRLPPHLGAGLEARPIIPGLDDDSLSNYAESEHAYDAEIAVGLPEVIDDAPRKYTLNNLFRDSTLTDKLRISARRMQSAKRLAVSDPSGAAATLTDYLHQHGFPKAVVLAGDYAKSVNNAVEFIHTMGRTIVYSDTTAPANVTNTQLQISFDQFHLKDIIWTVVGPLKYANEVNIVYQLAIQYGPEHVLFMLGLETLRLGIDIRNEKTGDYYTGEMHGYSSMSGILPSGAGFPSELTSDQQARLMIAGRKVSPICVGEAVIGSAVHVSDKHVILNEHTLAMAAQKDTVPEVCGSPITESMSVSGDVCVVKRNGAHAQWLFREPVVGERVVLCYHVGVGVEYSEVLRVVSCADQLILSSSNILRKGASGAAVIALRDSAMLGIFSTMRATRVVCSLFSSSSFAIVSDCQSIASVSQFAGTPGVDAGNHTYAKMVKRGLLGFLENIEQSTACLYAQRGGQRCAAGLVANVGGDWHTTVDPNEAQLTMSDHRMLSFSSSTAGTFVVNNPPPVLQAVPNVRIVEPGERVFLFSKVDDEVVMSPVRMVVHCMTDNKEFVVEDFGESQEQMAGGLIVAERDAAVLGMYAVRHCDSFGQFSVRCVSLARLVADKDSVFDVRAAYEEFSNWIVPVEDSFREYATYGNALWNVIVGRQAYKNGSTLSKALVASADTWTEQYRSVLDAMAWPALDFHVQERYGAERAAYAALAVLYLRGPTYVMTRMGEHLDSVVGVSLSVGEFPFPRSGSATGSAVSSRTAVDSPDSIRIQELEQRMLKLTQLVTTREKRWSGTPSDPG